MEIQTSNENNNLTKGETIHKQEEIDMSDLRPKQKINKPKYEKNELIGLFNLEFEK